MKKAMNKPTTARELLRQLAASGRLGLARYMQLDAALEASGEAGADMTDVRKRMINAMARFAYVLAWDTMNEHRVEDQDERAVYIPGGSRIEEYVPKRTPASARLYARELADKLEKTNGIPIEALFILAMIADASVGTNDAEEFATDLVFMANGHGVSWFDNHEEFDMDVPNYEYYL